MMNTRSFTLLAALIVTMLPGAAFAQRVPFERTFDVTGGVLDVTTTQGQIEVRAGAAGKVVVRGTVAARPPVAREGDTIRIQLPDDESERRAVTISYIIEKPVLRLSSR